ncbi:MAG: PRC-barrel domain-containing protein [Thermoleophilia bacterium]
MKSSAQELVGCEAFSRDGSKIGKVKEVIGDPESVSECLVIKYGLFRELVVPADVVEREGIGGRVLTVPLTHALLDTAPRVAKKGELSSDERARIDRFYRATVD